MVFDAAGSEFGMCSQPSNEVPNLKVWKFYSFLEAAKEPLWEGCGHLELSLAVRILSIKSEGNYSQRSFAQWTNWIRELSLQPNSIPKEFYQVKKLVSKLGLKEKKKDWLLCERVHVLLQRWFYLNVL